MWDTAVGSNYMRRPSAVSEPCEGRGCGARAACKGLLGGANQVRKEAAGRELHTMADCEV